LSQVSVDPEVANDLGFTEGMRVSKNPDATVHFEPDLGRQVRFVR